MDSVARILNDGSNSDSDLRKLARNVRVRLTGIGSIYDLHPIQNTSKYIFLIHPKGTMAGHWVAAVVHKKIAFYFDSFGIPPPEQIVRALGHRQILYNSTQIQALNQNHCGQFCVMFLKEVRSPKTFSDYLNQFHHINHM